MEGMGFHRKGVLWHIFGVLLSRAVGNYWKSLESLESLEPVGTVCWNLLEQGGYFVGPITPPFCCCTFLFELHP